MAIASTNPATGELLQSFDALTEVQIDEKLATAAAAFRSYRTTTFAERADWLRRAADILDAEHDAVLRPLDPVRRGRNAGFLYGPVPADPDELHEPDTLAALRRVRDRVDPDGRLAAAGRLRK